MPVSIIYLLPAPPNISENFLPSQALFNALSADHHLEPLPAWTLDHRLFRETDLGVRNGASPASSSSSTAFLQILNSTHFGGSSYLGISRRSTTTTAVAAATASTKDSAAAGGSGSSIGTGTGTGTGTGSAPSPSTSTSSTVVVRVPSGSQGSDEFYGMIATRFAPLWQRRSLTQVANGQAYEVGAFVVRFGEIRDKASGGGGGGGQGGGGVGAGGGHVQPVRGTIVEISTEDDDSDSDEDLGGEGGDGGRDESGASALHAIRHFWADLDIAGAKEFVRRDAQRDGFENVRIWLEALRIRA